MQNLGTRLKYTEQYCMHVHCYRCKLLTHLGPSTAMACMHTSLASQRVQGYHKNAHGMAAKHTYIRYGMYVLLTLDAYALGTVAKMFITATTFLAQLTGELLTDEASNSGFFSTLRVSAQHTCTMFYLYIKSCYC